MPQRILSTSYPVARKNYGCGACDWITEWLYDFFALLTFTEKKMVIRARQNGWRIMKGEKHIKATIVGCDNDLYTWRAIIEIDRLCIKYDVYEDVC